MRPNADTSRAWIGAGAGFLVSSILGYLLYELALRPMAGFPSDEMATILGGADTLRVGHWLKFGYAIGTALLTAGQLERLRAHTPLASLAQMTGGGATALFVASGMLGLSLLDTAQSYYPEALSDARATILMRIVTVSLFGAATFLSGGLMVAASWAAWQGGAWTRSLAYLGWVAGALFMLEFLTPEPWTLVAPLLGTVWLVWLVLSADLGTARALRAPNDRPSRWP